MNRKGESLKEDVLNNQVALITGSARGIAFRKWGAKEVGGFGNTATSMAPGQPEDIGEAVAYLASPAASYVTGEVLKICGGAGIGS